MRAMLSARLEASSEMVLTALNRLGIEDVDELDVWTGRGGTPELSGDAASSLSSGTGSSAASLGDCRMEYAAVL